MDARLKLHSSLWIQAISKPISFQWFTRPMNLSISLSLSLTPSTSSIFPRESHAYFHGWLTSSFIPYFTLIFINHHWYGCWWGEREKKRSSRYTHHRAIASLKNSISHIVYIRFCLNSFTLSIAHHNTLIILST